MIKTATIKKTSILILILAAAGLYLIAHNYQPTSAPTFICQEISALKPTAKSAAVETRPIEIVKTVPAPVSNIPMPIFPPKVLSSVLPEYPASALEKGAEGVAVIEVNIALDGSVSDLRIKSSSGSAEMDRSALSAVKQWKFSPALQGGGAIASVFEVPVRFKIWQ